MNKIRVAVFGASGYAGEELLRLLLRHNQAEIAAVTSRKNAGEPVFRRCCTFWERARSFQKPS